MINWLLFDIIVKIIETKNEEEHNYIETEWEFQQSLIRELCSEKEDVEWKDVWKSFDVWFRLQKNYKSQDWNKQKKKIEQLIEKSIRYDHLN